MITQSATATTAAADGQGRPPYAGMAAYLVRLRTAARLTQQELGAAPGLSRSAVQRAESGTTTCSPEMLRAYVTACRGSAADHAAVQALRARGRAAVRGVLRTLQAPHPAAARTRADFQAVLAAARESAGAPPLRAFSEQVPTDGAPIPLGSAARIARRQSLPANARQLETWLAVCRVPKAHLRHYRSAYSALHPAPAVRPVPAAESRWSGTVSVPGPGGPAGRRQASGPCRLDPTNGMILSSEARREAALNGVQPQDYLAALRSLASADCPRCSANLGRAFDRGGCSVCR